MGEEAESGVDGVEACSCANTCVIAISVRQLCCASSKCIKLTISCIWGIPRPAAVCERVRLQAQLRQHGMVVVCRNVTIAFSKQQQTILCWQLEFIPTQ